MTQTAEDWGERFRKARPIHDQFCIRLRDLVETLLRGRGIDVANIEARTKDVDSFINKIGRKQKYEDPLTEITDLVGVRITTYYLSDVDAVGGLLKEEFCILDDLSRDNVPVDPGQFGYAAKHYVLQLSANRKDLLEWKSFNNLVAEFQVRTALQHAWAAVSHKLDYKTTASSPAPLRRQLMRLSALFELADEQFELIRDTKMAFDKQNLLAVESGDLDIPVDASSLDAYLRDSPTLKELLSLGRDLGWNILDLEEDYTSDGPSDRLSLLALLQALGIGKIAELDNVLDSRGSYEHPLRGLSVKLQESNSGNGEMGETVEGLVGLTLAAHFLESASHNKNIDAAFQQYFSNDAWSFLRGR